jgi:hypothetical protein
MRVEIVAAYWLANRVAIEETELALVHLSPAVRFKVVVDCPLAVY